MGNEFARVACVTEVDNVKWVAANRHNFEWDTASVSLTASDASDLDQDYLKKNDNNSVDDNVENVVKLASTSDKPPPTLSQDHQMTWDFIYKHHPLRGMARTKFPTLYGTEELVDLAVLADAMTVACVDSLPIDFLEQDYSLESQEMSTHESVEAKADDGAPLCFDKSHISTADQNRLSVLDACNVGNLAYTVLHSTVPELAHAARHVLAGWRLYVKIFGPLTPVVLQKTSKTASCDSLATSTGTSSPDDDENNHSSTRYNFMAAYLKANPPSVADDVDKAICPSCLSCSPSGNANTDNVEK